MGSQENNCVNKLRVRVVYSKTPHYQDTFLRLKDDLEKEFPQQLDITGEIVSTTSAAYFHIAYNFEVSIQRALGSNSSEDEEMTLIHSKKGVDGVVDTPEKLQKIIDAIRKVLSNQVQ